MLKPAWYIVCLSRQSTEKDREFLTQRNTSDSLDLRQLETRSEDLVIEDLLNQRATYTTVNVLPKSLGCRFDPVATVRLGYDSRSGLYWLSTSPDGSRKNNLSELMTYDELLADIQG